MRTPHLLIAALLVASTAYAQNPPAQNPPVQNQPAPTNGPLVLERIHDGWVLAPDFKITDLNDRTGELAGAYGGRLIDNTLLIGGAGYLLTNDARDFKLAYGGVLIGWQSREFGRIRFGGRGLAGGGSATLGFDGGLPGRPVPQPLAGRGDVRFGVTDPRVQTRIPAPGNQAFPATRFIAREDFFVVEPQANVSARITRNIGLSCGVSYRQTAGTDFLGDHVNGPAANLAVQFGW
jgi:hypothetical protein